MSKKLWQKTERKDAVDFGARQTPKSGGFWWAKGDSRNEKFLIDSKDSRHFQYALGAVTWKKIAKEALLSNRIPVLAVSLGDKKFELVILDKNDFLELINNKE